MTSPPAPDTRSRIIQAANRLFYSQGIRPVSMDDIAAEAGLTKRSVYYHFASKDDLVVAYLRYRDRGTLRASVERRGGTPREQILAVFSELETAFGNARFRGCAFVNAAVELGDSESIRAVASTAKEATRAWLEELSRASGAREPRLLAEQLGVLVEGAFATWQVWRDPSPAIRAREVAAILVDSACPKAAVVPA